jgi:hypothetical protein
MASTPPYIDDPDLEERDTDPSELDPHTKAAREFAGLVRNMLEEKLGPIRDRLQIGDDRFGRVEAALQHLTNEIVCYREELRAVNRRLTVLEGKHAEHHPGDSMPAKSGG